MDYIEDHDEREPTLRIKHHFYDGWWSFLKLQRQNRRQKGEIMLYASLGYSSCRALIQASDVPDLVEFLVRESGLAEPGEEYTIKLREEAKGPRVHRNDYTGKPMVEHWSRSDDY